MQSRNRFSASDVILVRRSGRRTETLPTAPNSGIDHVHEAAKDTRTFLNAVASDSFLMEAILLSSASLAGELGRVADGAVVSDETAERLAMGVYRYLIRMRSRATPFGLMAGVSIGRVAHQTKTVDAEPERKAVRPDGVWLAAFIRSCEDQPQNIPTVLVWAHPTCHRRGDRLVIPAMPAFYVSPDEAAIPSQEGTIRLTPLVEHVLKIAAEPLTLADLASGLHAVYPTVPMEKLWIPIRTLLANGFLVSELWAAVDSRAPLDYLMGRLADASVGINDRLTRVRSVVLGYADAKLGDGVVQLKTANRVMREAATVVGAHATRTMLQVDLTYRDNFTLNKTVVSDVEAAANVLQRVGMPRSYATHLVDYHQDFAERYGLQNPVRLLDVIDPNRGIGVPATYERPAGPRSTRVPPQDPSTAMAPLADATMEAMMRGDGEVEMTDELVGALDQDPAAPPWPSVDITVQIHSESREAIDRGSYVVSVLPDTMATVAGRMYGRFLSGLDAIDPLRAAIERHQNGQGPGQVQMRFRPPYAPHLNVAHAPIVYGSAVSYDGGPPTADPTSNGCTPRVYIDIRDIALYATDVGLHAVHIDDGEELRFNALNMYTLRFTPNALRLLEEIEVFHSRPFTPWSWRALDALPRTPRVRHRRTVLYPARWRLGDLLGKASSGRGRWDEAVARWQRRLDVPNRIVVVVPGHRLAIDLERPLDRRVLQREVRFDPEVTIFEDLTAAIGSTHWLDGREHELTMSLFARPTAARPAMPRLHRIPGAGVARADEQGQFHLPGEDWAYFRLYLSASDHDTFLTHSIEDLLSRIDPTNRYFYIRYNQPQSHLRLRVQCGSHGFGALTAEVAAWARREMARGSLSGFEIAPYEPETWRYGSGKVMAAAEEVFYYDSKSVLTQLRDRLQARLQLSVQELAALNYLHILQSLDLPRWSAVIPEKIGRQRPSDVTRQQRRRLADLADVAGAWTRLAKDAAGQELIDSWQERSMSLREYGRQLQNSSGAAPGNVWTVVLAVLHMHFNRLGGIAPHKERQSMSLLRELLHQAAVMSNRP